MLKLNLKAHYLDCRKNNIEEQREEDGREELQALLQAAYYKFQRQQIRTLKKQIDIKKPPITMLLMQWACLFSMPTWNQLEQKVYLKAATFAHYLMLRVCLMPRFFSGEFGQKTPQS
ncbi:hypothetical protein KSP39_PZI010323 [Platanthera zijinensis]|uniref:Uncharacterized protein n=1 Tax=Platanthera zijinensis TaxID=2320716 RepID=A0AAP0BKS6_9ASPA